MKKILCLIVLLLLLCGCEVKSENSSEWIVDSGAPSSVVEGSEGDFYLDSSTYNLYQMNSSNWALLGKISGNDGSDGKDSTVSVNDEGFLVVNGEVTNTKIVGENGKDGEAGKDGASGKNGKDGKDGSSPQVTINSEGYVEIDNIKLNLKKYNLSCTLTNDVDGDKQADLADEITCGTEGFYVLKNDGTTVHMFAKYNLDVGNVYNNNTKELKPLENPTGIQKESSKAFDPNDDFRYGTIEFASEPYWDNGILRPRYGDGYPEEVYDSNSSLFIHMQNYKNYLNANGAEVLRLRLIELDELRSMGCSRGSKSCKNAYYDWIISSSYWTGTAENSTNIWRVNADGFLSNYDATVARGLGLRPVVEILDDNIIK